MEDKHHFLHGFALFRLPFTGQCVSWGLIVSGLLFTHQFYRYRHLTQSIFIGLLGGFVVGSGMWGYNMLDYTRTQQILRQQEKQKEKLMIQQEYARVLVKQRMGIEEADDQVVANVLNAMEDAWQQLDKELSEAQE